jgi:hypothetical protein
LSCTFLVCVSPFRRLLFFSPISNCQFQDLPPKRPRRTPFSGCSSRQNSRETPPLWARQTPPLWTSGISLYSRSPLLRGFPPPTPAKTFSAPPLSTPDPGPLHLEDSLLLMMFLFGHAVEIRRCSFQRHADDSHLPKADSCWSRDPTSPGCRTALDPPRYHVMWPGFHGEEYQ